MAQEFKAIITVLDKATEPLRRINRGLVGLSMPIKGIGGALGSFGRELGLVKLGGAATNALGKFQALGAGVSGVLGPVMALGAAAGAGGLMSLAKDAADYGEELDKAATKTGMEANELAKLHHVATAMHIETGVLDKGLVMLNRTLADSARGKNKDAGALFRKLHIDIGGMGKPIKTASEVLPQLTDAFMRTGNAAMRTSMATTIFKKSGAELLPILTLGRNEIARLSAEYERYFGKITPQMLKAMRDGDEAFDRSKLAAQGLKLSIGAALIPAMTKLIVPLTNWVVANRPLIAQRLSEWVSKVGTALANVDWNGVGAAVMGIAHGFQAVGKFLGPFWSLIAAGAVMFAPFVGAVAGATYALVLLGKEVAILGFKLAAWALAPVIGAIWNFIIALRAGYGAMAAFNLVLAANPISAIIIGVTALAAAAFLIWKYWAPIKGFFKGLWTSIVGFFDWAWQKIKPIVDVIAKAMSGMWSLMKWSPIGLAIQGGEWAYRGFEQRRALVHQQQSGVSLPVIQRFGAGGLAGANGRDGNVNIKVDLGNLPQGTRVDSKASPGLNLDVGRSFAAMGL